MSKFVKFVALVVVLNGVRYAVGYPLEKLFIFDRLFGAMNRSAFYFNTHFTAFDWTTSFFYNFMMWLTGEWVFVLLEPRLGGSTMAKSLKVYGLMFLFFASVSAIYMNHYSHPKNFYLWNILDGVIAFGIVAVANGILFPAVFRRERAQAAGAAMRI